MRELDQDRLQAALALQRALTIPVWPKLDINLDGCMARGTLKVLENHRHMRATMDNRRSERLSGYHELVHYALPFGEGPGLSAIRDKLDHLDLTPEEIREIAELDEIVMEELGYRDWIDDYVLRDDPDQPLLHWWWHLGKLRAGTYPAELLPPPLREIYRQGSARDHLRAHTAAT